MVDDTAAIQCCSALAQNDCAARATPYLAAQQRLARTCTKRQQALDHLHIQKIALVRWSDGAIIGLDLAIHHSDRLAQVFAFAANTDPCGVDHYFIDKATVFL